MTFREWLSLPEIDACKPALLWLDNRDAAASAADFAADAAAEAALRDMADLVRARIPWAVVEAALAKVIP